MATIAELVLKLRGDNTELRQTLADSAQRAVAFTMTIQDAMAMAGRNVARQEGMGALAAKSFLESMQATLASEQQRIKEQQYNMFITPAEAERLAGQAALAYNESILQTVSNLRASGSLTTTLERQLISSLDKAGLKAGLALQEAVAMGIQQGQSIAQGAASKSATGTFTAYSNQAEKSMRRSNLAITQASGAFTMFGHRGATALTAIGFGMEAFANGTEGGVRRSLRSVESFALFFGPAGLMVAALTTGLFALYDYFHKAEKRAEQAARTINGTLSAAINNADQLGVMKAYRDLLQGQASTVDQAGEITIAKPSEFAKGAFEGSLADLRAEQEQKLDYVKHHTDLLRAAYEVRLTKLGELIKPMEEREKMLTGILMTPPTQMNFVEPRKPIEIGGKSAEGQAAEATKRYYEELNILVGRLQAAQAAHQGYADILIKILDAYAKLGGASAAVTGAPFPGEKLEDTQRRLAMIKELGKVLQDIGPKVDVKVEGPDFDKSIAADLAKVLETPVKSGVLGEQMSQFDNLVSSVEVYRHNIELTNLDLQAHGQSLIDIDKALGPLRESAVAMAVELRKALRAAGLDPAIVDLLVQHWIEGLRKIGAAGADSATKLSRIADVMSKIADAAGAAASLNDSLRGNANTSSFLSSISSAGNSIGSAVAQGGTNVAADIQALSDTINIGNALTASSREIALEHKEMLKQNNERLAEVSMRLVGFAVSAGTSVQAQQALQALFGSPNALAKLASGATHTSGLFGTGKSGDLQTQIDALLPFLQSVGLTFEQFKKIAADNGFAILDKEGRLVTDALQQMRDKLSDVVRSLFTFQNTLGDQQSLAELQAKLSGAEDTPQAQVERNLALIMKLAPHLLPSGASAQGADAQDALRKMLQDLLQRIVAGDVSAADFGGFQNLQELIGVIDSTAGALNELRNVTNGVTAALTNVPTGFKLALLEFDMQDAMARSIASITPPDNVHPLSSGGVTINVEAGAVTIDPTNKNAAEIGQETLTALQALAGLKLGNRARWAGLN